VSGDIRHCVAGGRNRKDAGAAGIDLPRGLTAGFGIAARAVRMS
jgi:hypothetical protein